MKYNQAISDFNNGNYLWKQLIFLQKADSYQDYLLTIYKIVSKPQRSNGYIWQLSSD